jgi:predicted Zn-dependent protease
VTLVLKPRLRWPDVMSEKGRVVNQLDDASLRALVRAAEGGGEPPADTVAFTPPKPELPLPATAIWSEATYAQTAEARAAVARTVIDAAAAKQLLAAGYLEVRAGSRYWVENGAPHYRRFTQAQCAVTVRDPQGSGSGWAGRSSSDWAKLDAAALAEQALTKCVASRQPVALEPGRYTVILEPQAVADLLEILVAGFTFDRVVAEQSVGPASKYNPFKVRPHYAMLGRKVIDERLTLSYDPLDPELGIMPEVGTAPVTWIERGVLVNLGYNRYYALAALNESLPAGLPKFGYRLSGGDTSVDEMIASTPRGLLVTRFWGVKPLEQRSLLATGLTRDGLWLIENGKLTKPVKNFRFTESPLFVLNQIEQLGVPVPVFRPVRDPDFGSPWAPLREDRWYSVPFTPALTPAVVPAFKARDFSFTAMADAV